MLLLLSLKRWVAYGLILVIILASSVLYGQNAVTNAQESKAQVNAIINVCQTSFKFQTAELLADFYEDLNAVSANNQVVSEQINTIYEDFRSFKQQLNEFYTEVVDQVDVDFSIESNRNAIVQCDNIRAEATNIAQGVMQRFLTQAAANKRDLAIVQQYEELLTGSDRLLQELSGLKANFQNFSNRVPCIALSCVQN